MSATLNHSVVAAIITRLAGVLHGLIDSGTAACASPIGHENVLAFLAERRVVVDSLVVVLRNFLEPEANREPLKSHLDTVTAGARVLASSVTSLVHFRDMNLGELQTATESVNRSYSEVFAALRALTRAAGISVPYLESPPVGRAEHYQKILLGLFDTLWYEREKGAREPQ
jgi:hypothetical protein